MKVRSGKLLLVILLAFGFLGVVTADLNLDDLQLRRANVSVLPVGQTTQPPPPTATRPPSVRPSGPSSTSTTTTTTTTTTRPTTTSTTTPTTTATTTRSSTSARPSTSSSTTRSTTSSTTPSTTVPDCTDDEDEPDHPCGAPPTTRPPRPGQGGQGGQGGGQGGGQRPPTDRRKHRKAGDSSRKRRAPDDVIQNRLNDIRRKLAAADMYYVNWDPVLEQAAGYLSRSCDQPPQVSVRYQLRDAAGFVGVLPESYYVDDALQVIYDTRAFYVEIVSSHLMAFGCKIGPICSSSGGRRRRSSKDRRVFACVFAYSRPTSLGQPYRPGAMCSMCNSSLDALWCDRGLCRNCRPDDPSCDQTCHNVCSRCETVATDDRCKCLCYYDNNMSRCQDEGARASRDQPVCGVIPGGARPPPYSVTVLGISITVAVSFVLIILTIIIACCLRRIRVRQRIQQRRRDGQSTPRQSDDQLDNDEGPSMAELAAAAVIISPPRYEEIENEPKPPPYSSVFVVPVTAACPSYRSAIAGVGGSITARDRQTGTGSRNPPRRPPRRSGSGNGSGSGSGSTNSSSSRMSPLRTNIHDVTVAFDNNAYTSSRYLPQEEDA